MNKKCARARIFPLSIFFQILALLSFSLAACDNSLVDMIRHADDWMSGIVSIHITKLPVKTLYRTGEELDLAGLSVVAVFNDGRTEDVTGRADIDTSEYDKNYAGIYHVNVSLAGFTESFNVEVRGINIGYGVLRYSISYPMSPGEPLVEGSSFITLKYIDEDGNVEEDCLNLPAGWLAAGASGGTGRIFDDLDLLYGQYVFTIHLESASKEIFESSFVTIVADETVEFTRNFTADKFLTLGSIDRDQLLSITVTRLPKTEYEIGGTFSVYDNGGTLIVLKGLYPDGLRAGNLMGAAGGTITFTGEMVKSGSTSTVDLTSAFTSPGAVTVTAHFVKTPNPELTTTFSIYVDVQTGIKFFLASNGRYYENFNGALLIASSADTITILNDTEFDAIATIPTGTNITLNVRSGYTNKITRAAVFTSNLFTIEPGASLTVDGGSGRIDIDGGRLLGRNGEALFNINGGDLIIEDGVFLSNNHNSNSGTGGAIRLGSGVLNMQGGVISGGSAAMGSGVYMTGGVFKMAGKAALSRQDDVYLGGTCFITVDGDLVTPPGTYGTYTNAHITAGTLAIGRMVLRASTGNLTEANARRFTLQEGWDLKISGSDGKLIRNVFYVSGSNVNPQGDDASGEGSESNPYASVQKAVDEIASGGSGTIYIRGEITTGTGGSGLVEVNNKTVVLHGLGAGAALNANSNRRILYAGTSSVTVNNLTLKGGTATDGGGAYLDNQSTLNLNSGATITNCRSTSHGGGVYVYNGTLTMNNGAITNCGAANNGGGGVYVYNGTLTMNNGAITNCTAATSGGGVYATNNGTLTMGGTALISDEVHLGSGSTININSNLTVHSPTNPVQITLASYPSISNSTEILTGSVTSNDNYKKFFVPANNGIPYEVFADSVSSGKVRPLPASGEVYIMSGTRSIMNGSSLAYAYDNWNTAVAQAPNGGTLIVAGPLTSANAVASNGSLFEIPGTGGTLTIKGINDTQGRSASLSAAGAFARVMGVENKTVYLENITLTGANVPAFEGAGLRVGNGAAVTLGSGSAIQNNRTTTANGGGVYVDGGTFNMSDGVISGNTAGNGGGVYLESSGNLIMSGGAVIIGNTNNDVKLAGTNTIKVSGTLNPHTGTSATITLDSYVLDAAVIQGYGTYTLTLADVGKFTLGSGSLLFDGTNGVWRP